MKKLTATLLNEQKADGIKQGNHRFYKLNHSITKGKSTFRDEIDISKEDNEWFEALRFKDETVDPKKILPFGRKGTDEVLISEAHTHSETLVFSGILLNINKEKVYARTGTQIGGVHTMMIHGGDPRSQKQDEVYLRILARDNGYEFGGIKLANNK